MIFNTGNNSVKAKNIQRDNRVSLCVDDQVPLYSFVIIDGVTEIINTQPKELFKMG
jgi:general stress protein 26